MVRLNQLLWSAQYVTQRIPGDRTEPNVQRGVAAFVVRLHTFTTFIETGGGEPLSVGTQCDSPCRERRTAAFANSAAGTPTRNA